MSGHSKWSTIKRQKGVADQKRGTLFTKLTRAISIAVKTGGGTDPEFNFKLRMAIDKAKSSAMPHDNIERAIKKGSGEGKEAIEAVSYEGYGPAGTAIIVEAITDNKNRTTANIRTIFNRNEGKLGEQGSVAWMFEAKGEILIEKQPGVEDLSLELIDQGVEDVKITDEGLEIYTLPMDLEKIKKFITDKNIKILNSELILRPAQNTETSESDRKKIQQLLETLQEDDDVINVHTNVNL
ncbi:MAG: YebC/PmpR family DNA-binding transcriptional regulator [bacterium]|nr:YebC/PmpR family DNA-binding transcriptional regulator [bacterium]